MTIPPSELHQTIDEGIEALKEENKQNANTLSWLSDRMQGYEEEIKNLKEKIEDLHGQIYYPVVGVMENGNLKRILTLRGILDKVYKKVFFPLQAKVKG